MLRNPINRSKNLNMRDSDSDCSDFVEVIKNPVFGLFLDELTPRFINSVVQGFPNHKSPI
jgi:hypothetical protein